MNIKITMAVMATAFALTACGNIKNDIPGRETTPGGTLTATEAGEKGFERIETYGKFNVFFVQDDRTSVELRGDSEQIARTEIKCDGRTLAFSMRRKQLGTIAKNAGEFSPHFLKWLESSPEIRASDRPETVEPHIWSRLNTIIEQTK